MIRPHRTAGLLLLIATTNAIAEDEPDAPADPPRAATFLESGELVIGQQTLEAALRENPEDDEARFGLGLLKVVRAAERFGQALHEYGATPAGTRLPIAENPNPSPITYERSRRVLDDLRRDLVDAEETLAGITDDDVQLPIRLARIHLDLDGDGNPDDRFLEVLGRVMRQRDFAILKDNPDFLVKFDRGDVPWLRGYCHLVCGVLDTILAFDTEAQFRRSVARNFANPAEFDGEPEHNDHNLHTTQPLRLGRMRRHFVAVCELNRETWKHVRRETDDDHEWLPNPRQTGVLGMPVDDEMIDAWLAMAEELRATFEGERTFLRIFIEKDEKGLNLKALLDDPPRTWYADGFPQNLPARYFTTERDMDLNVLFRGFRAFRGSPIGYAIWFN